MRFLWDGERCGCSASAKGASRGCNRLKEDSTPEMLNMNDGDVIDAVAQQTGGSAALC